MRKMSRQMTVAIAGLGSRGRDTYAKAAKIYPDKMKIVAIADIDPEKVKLTAEEYDVPMSHCYESAEDMLKEEKLADAMIIATQDRQHVGQAIKALKKGYHLLLEKPISPDLGECRKISEVAKECKREVVVCHVLRYTPIYQKVKEILDAGTIGDVISIMAIENVGWFHQAHSFVRGNWANSDETSPMILQKCCHDMDLYLWLANKTCRSLTSYGELNYFKTEHAPEGCTDRCLEGCKAKDNCIKDKVDCVEIPTFNGKEDNCINGLGYAVFEGSKNKEAAEDFAIWLGSKEAQEIQGKTGVVISARTDAQKYFAEANSQYNLAAYTNHADEAYPLPVCAKAAELYDLEATELQKAYNGEKSLSDVCKGLTKQADKLLQE